MCWPLQAHLAHPRLPPYQQTPAQLRYTYTAEFDFRYNTRKMTDAERMALSIHGIVGKRLTSRRTNGAAKAQASRSRPSLAAGLLFLCVLLGLWFMLWSACEGGVYGFLEALPAVRP